ncbi:MAG: ATP-binding cassette domain-containing protein [Dehalococcoidia bacterium]|nr:ATP-binding cassette domain-containing protein [Dehalococcoidia bacterium]
MTNNYAIETFDLTRKYGDIVALDNLNLKIGYSEVFGLLGPNGAGKTTAISILCTIINATSGTALVNGFDIRKQPDSVRRSIGIVFQDPSIDDRLTGRENLQLHATLYDIPSSQAKKKIAEVLELVGLTDRANAPMKTYSGGMKRRLELARGLLHSPRVLFLDEPTLGLDLQTRDHLWNYISEMARKAEITVILTTHYMEEAERLCSRMAIIDFGKIKVTDTPANLKATLKGDVITVKSDRAQELALKLKESALAPVVESTDNTLRLAVPDGEKLVPRLIEIAAQNGFQVNSVSIHKPTLNDVFLHYTGREISEEEAESSMRVHMRAMSRMK